MKVEVWHLMDDTMAVDRLETDGRVNAKILPGGRGYVKLPGRVRLYARVELIRIDDEGGAS